jgi:dihydroneopterin aldolase
MSDAISIVDIEVQCRIGVPEEERAHPQRLLISVELELDVTAAAQADDISKTINYHSVYLLVKKLCGERERQLIETLAEEIAAMLLEEFETKAVRVEIRKFILPGTRHVAVRIERRA